MVDEISPANVGLGEMRRDVRRTNQIDESFVVEQRLAFQLRLMKEKRRCSILFYLPVPGLGMCWSALRSSHGGSAYESGASCSRRAKRYAPILVPIRDRDCFLDGRRFPEPGSIPRQGFFQAQGGSRNIIGPHPLMD